VTIAPLREVEPGLRQCIHCGMCLEACPTGALDQPYHLAAERCIAYLTVEHLLYGLTLGLLAFRGEVRSPYAAQQAKR
jgi:ferredoxin